MLLDWSEAAEAQLSGAAVRPGVLFRIDSEDPLRLWAGRHGIRIAADLIEEDDQALYSGIGLISIPKVSQLINGVASRADFQLSPIDARMAELASSEADSIRGVAVHLGFLVFDANWQIMSPTAWLWEGVADSLQVTREGAGKKQSWSINLSVGSALTGRRRPPNAFWTNPDQQRLHPTDRAFERVRRISQGTVKTWPE